MTANQIKNRVMAYFRYVQSYSYVATECWDADVIASNGSNMIEVEVKISWDDYVREWKKYKYLLKWANPGLHSGRLNPNRRYFAAPADLAKRIAADISVRNHAYGVISIPDDVNAKLQIIKRGKSLHADPINPKALLDIVKRNSSELITLRNRLASPNTDSANERPLFPERARAAPVAARASLPRQK
jgi:hypothetical protein